MQFPSWSGSVPYSVYMLKLKKQTFSAQQDETVKSLQKLKYFLPVCYYVAVGDLSNQSGPVVYLLLLSFSIAIPPLVGNLSPVLPPMRNQARDRAEFNKAGVKPQPVTQLIILVNPLNWIARLLDAFFFASRSVFQQFEQIRLCYFPLPLCLLQQGDR